MEGVAHQVDWEPKVGEDNHEEDEVHEEVQHVGEELQVEDVDALVLPAALQPGVNHGQGVLEEGADDGRGQDDVLEGEQQVHARALLQRLADQVLQECAVHGLQGGSSLVLSP